MLVKMKSIFWQSLLVNLLSFYFSMQNIQNFEFYLKASFYTPKIFFKTFQFTLFFTYWFLKLIFSYAHTITYWCYWIESPCRLEFVAIINTYHTYIQTSVHTNCIMLNFWVHHMITYIPYMHKCKCLKI